LIDNLLARLEKIIGKLSKKESLSTPLLAVEFGVSTKVIRSDFNHYILPYVKEVKYDYSTKHYTSETFFLESHPFTPKEFAIMLIVKFKFSENSIGELFDDYKLSLENALYTKRLSEPLNSKTDPILIENAIKENILIGCEYNGKQRKLFPLKIM